VRTTQTAANAGFTAYRGEFAALEAASCGITWTFARPHRQDATDNPGGTPVGNLAIYAPPGARIICH